MAAPSEEFVIEAINSALEREKHQIFRHTSNAHILDDISKTIRRLQSISESVVRSNYGTLRDRFKHELIPVYPILQRQMDKIKISIMRRLLPRMSKVHPWIIYFDVNMALEVFEVLRIRVLSLTSYGLQIEETDHKIHLTFTSLKRFESLFKKFDEFSGFAKQLKDSGHVKLIISNEKPGELIYKKKEEKIQVRLAYGYWNDFGLRQH